jgi:hypothetical protein
MPKKLILSVPLLALAACQSGGPAGPPPGTAAQRIVVTLAATPYNAGETGQATLIPAGAKTQVVLNFSGVPPWTTLPVHVYTYIVEGRCGAVPARAAYDLNERVLPDIAAGGPVTSTKRPFVLAHLVAAPIERITSGEFALVLRSAPADGDRVLFCGELRAG